MGVTGSKSVIRNGDWEHKLCWMDVPEPKEDPKQDEEQEDNSVKMRPRLSLTRISLKVPNAADCIKGNNNEEDEEEEEKQVKWAWQRLQETKQGIELQSLSSSTCTTEDVLI